MSVPSAISVHVMMVSSARDREKKEEEVRRKLLMENKKVEGKV
jgi:hypothetical protein